MSIWGDVLRNIPIVGDIASQQDLRDASKRRTRDLQQMEEELYGSLEVPELSVAPSALGSYRGDPALRGAQMRALNELSRIGAAGGMTLEDKAALADIQRTQRETERGQREAIMQQAAQSGNLGAGSTLGAQLMAQQASANRAGQRGLDVAAMAQRRALESLTRAGAMGGVVREQDFGEASKKAEAQDIINRFNAGLASGAFDQRRQLANDRAAARQGQVASRYGQAEQTAQQQAATRGLLTDIGMTAVTSGFNTGASRPPQDDQQRRRGGFGGFGG